MDDIAVKPSLYDDDFYAWTQAQAELLRNGRLDEADIANILEEIETLGRKEVSPAREPSLKPRTAEIFAESIRRSAQDRGR